MIEQMDESKALDILEKIVINACLPTIEFLKKESKQDLNMDSYTMARNMVGRIGLRIVFGKTVDKTLLDLKNTS